jgi:hypothetical protein
MKNKGRAVESEQKALALFLGFPHLFPLYIFIYLFYYMYSSFHILIVNFMPIIDETSAYRILYPHFSSPGFAFPESSLNFNQ